MIKSPRERFFNRTVPEYIRGNIWEMQNDGVGFWGIADMGRRGFGYEGAELVAFLRNVLLEMMKAGARPVLGGGGSGYYWLVQEQYGSQPAEIVENVLKEWITRGMGEEDAGWLWFTVRDCYEAQYSLGDASDSS
jgi:hypothetical protein